MKVRVASAGTGKTTSLVLRYLELIAADIPLRRIAGVTFTRKSAHELRQRVAEGINEVLSNGKFLDFALAETDHDKFIEAKRELEGASLSTIHGFMIESLRLVAPIMGLDPDFSVLGEWEAQAIFEEEMRSLLYLAQDPNHGLHNVLKLKNLEDNLLELFKKRSLSKNFSTDNDISNSNLKNAYERIYSNFSLRFKASLLSPAEIERQAIKLANTKQALGRVSSRFKILLIDEYQDLNPLQGEFFSRLEQSGINIEVVGDPKQSIYGFRNADVRVFRKALATGQVLEPLNKSYRHSQVVNRFLNKMTDTLAHNNLGFSASEAPKIEAVRKDSGHLEIHWVTGKQAIAKLREYEASVLARRLRHAHEFYGTEYHEMAVLARSYGGLKIIETALSNANLPNVLLQGRGYFDRIEIRDIYNALKVGIDASGASLAAWLRSPYANLKLAQVNEILLADKPLLALEKYPEVLKRLKSIQQLVKGKPVDALKFLIREKFIANSRYVDFLDKKQRENIDALLFTVVMQPPGEIEFLLDRLEHLSLQSDAGDVPQSGQGIKLLTIHGSKGLEWPLVAVFDLGRGPYHPPSDIFVNADSGYFAVRDSSNYEKLQQEQKDKSAEEDYRLLYVAASRAKDVLLLSGSIKNGKTASWTKALSLMGLGAESDSYNQSNFVLQTHHYQKLISSATNKKEEVQLKAASWIDQKYARPKYPAVISPSYLKKQEYSHEPLNLPEQSQGEIIPGRATTIGTLAHDAISQNWQSSNKHHLDNLRAQELMFPFKPEEQDDIMTEVKEILENYEDMLAKQIPALEQRVEDYAELAMLLPVGETVVQGIIDRLYKVGDSWYLEDYKTDRKVEPENYHLQLALYFDAVQKVLDIEPIVQLVYLRSKKLVVLEQGLLIKTLAENSNQINMDS